MASFTSKADGNWASSGQTTWNEAGFPVAGDTATVNHAVTVSSDATIGASGATGTAALTIGAGPGARLTITDAKLTLQGDLICSDKATFPLDALVVNATSAPAGIEFNPPSGSSYKVQAGARCDVRFAGTSANHAFLRTVAGAAAADRGYFTSIGLVINHIFTWTDFTRIGTSRTNSLYHYINTNLSVLAYSRCRLDTCWPIYIPASAAGASITLDNVIDVNPRDTYSFYFVEPGSAFTAFRIAGCAFMAQVFMAYARNLTNTGNYYHVRPFFTGNYLYNQAANSGNLYRLEDGSSQIFLCGDVADCVFFGDSTIADDNFHFVGIYPQASDATVSGCVAEHSENGNDGEYYITQSPTVAGRTLTFDNCIAMPPARRTQSQVSFQAAGGPNVATRIRHCTYWAGWPDSAYVGENNSDRTGIVSAFQSNIAWYDGGLTPVGPKFYNSDTASGTTKVDPISPVANCDYNAGWNTINSNPSYTAFTNQGRGYLAKWSATPGAHDIDVVAGTPGALDPQFVDATRAFPRFAKDYLGATAGRGTWADATGYAVGDVVEAATAGYYSGVAVQYRCTIAHTSSAASPNSGKPGSATAWRNSWEFHSLYLTREAVAAGTTITDSSLGLTSAGYIAAYRAWVRAGMAPRNVLLRDAGHDGVTVGAVPSAASPPPTAGVASFVSSGPAGIALSATPATGGAPAIAARWQRMIHGGTTFIDLADGGVVSGSGTLTLFDGSAVAGTLYDYRCKYTDAVSATAFSAAVPASGAQLYAGGPIGSGGAVGSQTSDFDGGF